MTTKERQLQITLEAATEFNKICCMLEERFGLSFSAGDDYWTMGEKVYSGNPTQRLHELIDGFYAGTPAGKRCLLTDGFAKHGYNMGDVVSDVPFGGWPHELGMDKGGPGVFEKDGAMKFEREELLYWIPLRISAAIGAARFYNYQPFDSDLAEIREFLIQTEEYQELFGERYDVPKPGDSNNDLKMIDRAKSDREFLQKYLEAGI